MIFDAEDIIYNFEGSGMQTTCAKLLKYSCSTYLGQLPV